MKSITCLVLFISFTSKALAQDTLNKESIYIAYDQYENHDKIGEKDRIRFIIDSESFLYDASKNCKSRITFDQIRDSLITVHQAKKKADEYIDRVMEKWKKEANDTTEKKIAGYLKNSSIRYYNKYFEDIYLYVMLDKKEGVLYKVKWESFVE